MKKLTVDVWSDIACPWCWVGKRRLEAALSRFDHRDDVEVVWRAFELDPSAPRVLASDVSYAQRLAKKYGASVAQAQGMIRNMTEVGAKDGLAFDFDRIRPGNTFDAHRVLHLALERGRQDAVKERLFRGYFSEGAQIGETATIAKLASDAGLDADEVAGVLASDTYADEVRAEEEEARAVGISGVPFFVLGGKYAVSGAQPAELLHRALERAWAEAPDLAEPGEGAACAPDGCS